MNNPILHNALTAWDAVNLGNNVIAAAPDCTPSFLFVRDGIFYASNSEIGECAICAANDDSGIIQHFAQLMYNGCQLITL